MLRMASPKNWGPGPQERQDKVDTICTVPLDCGTPTTRRLYPFGANHHHVVVVDLPLLRVAVEGSDNPVSLEKPCQTSLPP